jgi:hypothetical protein
VYLVSSDVRIKSLFFEHLQNNFLCQANHRSTISKLNLAKNASTTN